LQWTHLLLLTDAAGDTEDQPLYLMVRAYAGSKATSLSAVNSTVNSIVSSLGYRYLG
jgi:hypothetical protein